jgi:hypothetical protein
MASDAPAVSGRQPGTSGGGLTFPKEGGIIEPDGMPRSKAAGGNGRAVAVGGTLPGRIGVTPGITVEGMAIGPLPPIVPMGSEAPDAGGMGW